MNATQNKALNLLGSGVSPEATAAACGVSASYISQLLSTEIFSQRVSELRYKSHMDKTKRDDSYNCIEDRLIDKLNNSIPLLIRPADILGAIRVINGTTRRGASNEATQAPSTSIVNIILPAHTAIKFTTNTNNQVITAGDQSLLTMPSTNLLNQIEMSDEERLRESQSILVNAESSEESPDTINLMETEEENNLLSSL